MTDEVQPHWALRAPLYVAIGAIGAWLVNRTSDLHTLAGGPPLAETLTAFLVVATLFLLTTLDRVRPLWSLAASLACGAVIALSGWFTARYNSHGELLEYPFLAALLAVVIAAPLFQVMRDNGRWGLDYPRLHRHAWTDAVIGGASLLFTLLSLALAWLVAALFDAIGINALKKMMETGWFVALLLGAAFGGAMALLRDREKLAPTLQRLVIALLRVLAPILALSLGIFLLAVPVTGLSGLWKSGLPETPLMLTAAAFAVLLVNAVIGDGVGDSDDEAARGRWLWRSAMLLLAIVLPLALIALLSMAQRVGQYGWTPDRLWGITAGLVALGYGAIGLFALLRGRFDFDDRLRPLQARFSVAVCALALFLAMPILDFGRISTGSQLARLHAGAVAAREFDWRALAFEFGPSGRAALRRIAAGGSPDQRLLAAAALKGNSRWDVAPDLEAAVAGQGLDQRLRIQPRGVALDPKLRDAITRDASCRDKPCVLTLAGKEAYLVGNPYSPERMVVTRFVAQKGGGWSEVPISGDNWPDNRADLKVAPVEIRTVTRRQMFVDGKPAGSAFE